MARIVCRCWTRGPRWAAFRDGPAWVYDVAVERLHPGQVDRLAAYVARRRRVGYEEAWSLVRAYGLTIRADGVEIVAADAWKGVSRFSFLGGVVNASACASSVFGS